MDARTRKRAEAFRKRLGDVLETLEALHEDYVRIEARWRNPTDTWMWIGGDLDEAVKGVEEAIEDLDLTLAPKRKGEA